MCLCWLSFVNMTYFQGYLWGGSAWTAENSDFQQALIIDLGSVKNVTGIATQVLIFIIYRY